MKNPYLWWFGQIFAWLSGLALALDGHGFGISFFASFLITVLVDIRENTGDRK